MAGRPGKIVDMARLPPTIDVIHIHSKRAYLQIQTWIGNALNPKNYGWRMRDGMLEPIPMYKKPAPDNLLDIMKCSCKEMRCKGRNCLCYGNFQKCTLVCCCQNCEQPFNDEDEDAMDDVDEKEERDYDQSSDGSDNEMSDDDF